MQENWATFLSLLPEFIKTNPDELDFSYDSDSLSKAQEDEIWNLMFYYIGSALKINPKLFYKNLEKIEEFDSKEALLKLVKTIRSSGDGESEENEESSPDPDFSPKVAEQSNEDVSLNQSKQSLQTDTENTEDDHEEREIELETELSGTLRKPFDMSEINNKTVLEYIDKLELKLELEKQKVVELSEDLEAKNEAYAQALGSLEAKDLEMQTLKVMLETLQNSKSESIQLYKDFVKQRQERAKNEESALDELQETRKSLEEVREELTQAVKENEELERRLMRIQRMDPRFSGQEGIEGINLTLSRQDTGNSVKEVRIKELEIEKLSHQLKIQREELEVFVQLHDSEKRENLDNHSIIEKLKEEVIATLKSKS